MASNAFSNLTTGEQNYLMHAFQCLTEPIKVDYKKMAEVMSLTNSKSCSNGFNAALKKLTGKTAAGLGVSSQSDNGTEKSPKPKATPRKPVIKKATEPQVKSEGNTKEESGEEDGGDSATQNHGEGSGVSSSKNEASKASPAPTGMGRSSQAPTKGEDKAPTKKSVRKAGEIADEVKTPAKKRAKKEPELDAQGSPVKATRTRKPKLEDDGNVVAPKPRARKTKDAPALGPVPGATPTVKTPAIDGMVGTSATNLTKEQRGEAIRAAKEALTRVEAMDVVAEPAAWAHFKKEHHLEVEYPELEYPVQLGEEIDED